MAGNPNTQTIATLTQENKTFYNKTLLARLLPNLVYQRYGQKKPMPKNEGDTVNFRKFNSLEPKTTPLTEGETPDGSALSISTLTATVKQYGDYVTISDKLDLIAIDPVITEATQLLGESAALLIDTIVRDEIIAGTNVQYAGGKAGTDSITKTDVITSTEIRKAVRTLRKNNAKPQTGKYFIGIIDPEVAFDIMNDPLWQDISKYNGGTAIEEGEVGRIGGVRFIETTNTKVEDNSSSVPIHYTMILGKDAYGVVDIDGSVKPQTIIKPHGSAGTADPLNQRATVGYKLMFTAKRLDEFSMIRIESAASE